MPAMPPLVVEMLLAGSPGHEGLGQDPSRWFDAVGIGEIAVEDAVDDRALPDAIGMAVADAHLAGGGHHDSVATDPYPASGDDVVALRVEPRGFEVERDQLQVGHACAG